MDAVRGVLSAHAERVSVLAVNYHTALANPETAAAEINRFLGGNLDEAAMAKAIAPALRRQGG